MKTAKKVNARASPYKRESVDKAKEKTGCETCGTELKCSLCKETGHLANVCLQARVKKIWVVVSVQFHTGTTSIESVKAFRDEKKAIVMAAEHNLATMTPQQLDRLGRVTRRSMSHELIDRTVDIINEDDNTDIYYRVFGMSLE